VAAVAAASETLRKWLHLVEHATNAVEDAVAAAYCIEMPPPAKGT
jgi:hypothetical protein